MTRSSKSDARALPGQVVLVFQGGGALGAYQVGVYQALHEAGIEPDWVIGTSIGAINGALIAGNRAADRLARLDAFWQLLQQPAAGALRAPDGRLASMFATADTVMRGIPGFFAPSAACLGWPHWGSSAAPAAYYDTAPLRRTLAQLLDGACLAAGKPRLTVGAVNVCSGAMQYFDSRDEALGIEHVMASGALPPAFPAVRVKGEAYWDGGVYSNTPLEAVFDDRPRRDALIFAVNVWHARGPEPGSIWDVLGRQKDIQYASRTDSHVLRQQQLHRLRHIIGELGRRLPPELAQDPPVRDMLAYGCTTRMHVVRLQAPRLEREDVTKDIDFTPAGVAARRRAGYADTARMIERAPWRDGMDALEGVAIHDPEP